MERFNLTHSILLALEPQREKGWPVKQVGYIAQILLKSNERDYKIRRCRKKIMRHRTLEVKQVQKVRNRKKGTY